MQGAVSGYIWVQNDGRYRFAEFGKNRDYWESRLRAAAYLLCLQRAVRTRACQRSVDRPHAVVSSRSRDSWTMVVTPTSGWAG